MPKLCKSCCHINRTFSPLNHRFPLIFQTFRKFHTLFDLLSNSLTNIAIMQQAHAYQYFLNFSHNLLNILIYNANMR